MFSWVPAFAGMTTEGRQAQLLCLSLLRFSLSSKTARDFRRNFLSISYCPRPKAKSSVQIIPTIEALWLYSMAFLNTEY